MNTQTLPSPAFDENTLADSSAAKQKQVLLEWTAPSHFNHERSHRWYLISAVLVIGIAAYALLTGAWSVAVVTLLLGGVYFLTRREPTALKYVAIERDGMQFEGTFLQWSQCKEFWLVQTPLFTTLTITRKTGFPRLFSVQTGNIDPTVIRSTLSQFLPMKADQRETLLDVIIRICKL